MTPSTLRRLGLRFRLEWWARGVLVMLTAGCAPIGLRYVPDAPEVLDECHALKRDVEFVCSMRKNICGDGVILCPGDSVKTGTWSGR